MGTRLPNMADRFSKEGNEGSIPFLYLILVRSSVYIYKRCYRLLEKKGIQQRDWVTSSLVEQVSINLIFINIK